MNKQNHCPCCHGSSFKEHFAVVSPFIASYALKSKAEITKLKECCLCNFRFFEDRFTDEEASVLYANYRGNNYYSARHRHEFWYSKVMNDCIGHDPGEISRRKRRTFNFINSHLPITALNKVLDYGGDEGQFIPDELGKEKYLYEISAAKVLQNIKTINSEAELKEMSFDLVMLSHVLEHYSDPSSLLQKIHQVLNSGGHLYVEVPLERFKISHIFSRQIYVHYLQFLLRHPFWFSVVDFISTAFRKKLNILLPGHLIKLHEHINFFDQSSLESLFKNQGYTTPTIELHEDVIMCLVQKGTT